MRISNGSSDGFSSDLVGGEAHILEAEKAARAGEAGMDVIDDQQRAMRFRNVRDPAQTFGGCGVEPAFALHRFDEDRRGGIEPARRIGEALLEQVGGVDRKSVVWGKSV